MGRGRIVLSDLQKPVKVLYNEVELAHLVVIPFWFTLCSQQ